jgi:hypothetical protein
MDNPTYDEAIYMIRLKRERAKEAIEKIIVRYSVISNEAVPGMDVLLDYFVNMVYALELLLKVLAKDWDVPGQTKYGHKVGKMYEAVLGHPHVDPTLMKELEDAIVNQKFIYEPTTGLLNRVEALEKLWDELKREYMKGAWGKKSTVQKQVRADASFGNYLANNVDRFTRLREQSSEPVMTREDKLAWKRYQVEQLHREIAQLETKAEEPREISSAEFFEKKTRQFKEEVERRQHMMRFSFQMRGTAELEFMIWVFGIAWEDLG